MKTNKTTIAIGIEACSKSFYLAWIESLKEKMKKGTAIEDIFVKDVHNAWLRIEMQRAFNSKIELFEDNNPTAGIIDVDVWKHDFLSGAEIFLEVRGIPVEFADCITVLWLQWLKNYLAKTGWKTDITGSIWTKGRKVKTNVKWEQSRKNLK